MNPSVHSNSLFEKKKDMLHALTSMRIETPEAIADSVVNKVMAVVEQLEDDVRTAKLPGFAIELLAAANVVRDCWQNGKLTKAEMERLSSAVEHGLKYGQTPPTSDL